METASLLALTLAASLAAMFLLWLVSIPIRDVSIVDIWWGPGFAFLAGLSAWAAAGHALATTLTVLWGLRLGIYLGWRNYGHGEDSRYRAMRRREGGRFVSWSLFAVFGLQGVLMWFVSLPVQLANLSGSTGIGWLGFLGLALYAVGLFFETVGDWQLARFRADRRNRGRVLDTGLWRYTRHPNYFGDFCVWWGLFAISLEASGAWLTIASPLVMSFLLLRVSGVALLERTIGERRPAYAEYVRRTSAFFPRPPSH